MYNIKLCTKEIFNQKVIKLYFQFHFIIFNYINCNIHAINNTSNTKSQYSIIYYYLITY